MIPVVTPQLVTRIGAAFMSACLVLICFPGLSLGQSAPVPAEATSAPVATEASAETTVTDKVPTAKELRKAVQTAAKLLVKNQERYTPDRPVGRLPDAGLKEWQENEKKRLDKIRAEGGGNEWPYEGVYRVRPDGRIPPGYRVGGTAIVCEALLEAPKMNSERRQAIERGVDFMLDLIANDKGMVAGPKKGYDVRGWGHAYALKFFLVGLEKKFFKGPRKKFVEEAVPHLLHCVGRNQTAQGGWNYAGDSAVSPFMTGSTLLALFHAKASGYDVDSDMVERALKALAAGRAENGAFAYSGTPRRAVHMAASAARSTVAELVLFKAGRSDQAKLEVAVEGFFEHWDELLKRKSQQGTHVGPYAIAPYYFFYGHCYTALAIEHLEESKRAPHRKRMLEMLWRTREAHGGWNDRIFPRTESYSTAMSILAMIAPDLPAVHSWGKPKKSSTGSF